MTITEQIKKAFDPYYEMPLEGWKTFTDLGEVVQRHKNDIIKESNQVERFLYFIVSGSYKFCYRNIHVHCCKEFG